MKRLILLSLGLTALTGCIYKMPTEESICTLPATNNPSFTRERAPSLIPGQ